MERKDRDLETAQCACCGRYEDNRPSILEPITEQIEPHSWRPNLIS